MESNIINKNIFSQEKLHEKLDMFISITEKTSDLVSTVQLDQNILYMNRCGLDFFGWEENYLEKGYKIPDIHPKWAYDKVNLEGIPIALEEGIWRGETAILGKDGKEVLVSQIILAHRTTTGELDYLSTIMRDISKEKAKVEQIVYSKLKYRTLFENNPLGFAYHEIIVDDKGDPIDYRYIDANDVFEKFTGLSPNHIIGKTVTEVLPGIETDPADWIRIFGKVGLTGKPILVEEFSETLSRWYQIFAYSPKKGFFSVFFSDITEQKMADIEKLRVQKLESIGILAGGLAHDFNNILMGILGNVNLLQDSKLKFDSETQEIIEDIITATKRATDITTQLLTFAKGGEPIKKAEKIRSLIEFSIKQVMSGSKSPCEIIEEEKIPPVLVDAGQIQQVINNILINADQAMETGGIVKVTLSVANIIEENNALQLIPGQFVKVSIKDQGKGIPKEVQDKIFNPYFSTKKKGMGLGLATAFSIIKRHKGKMCFYSEEEKGTTFNIYLPRANTKSSTQDPNIDSVLTKHGRLLILEDDPTVQNTITKMLTKLEQEFVLVDDGKRILDNYKAAQFTNNPFDLVILDLTIPGGLGGKQTISELLKIEPDIKAIVSSGYSTDPIMANYESYGFKDVLIKPYTLNQIKKILQVYL
jgi:PAS domain S-box-containing protein